MHDYNSYVVSHRKTPVGLFSSVVDAVRLTKGRKEEFEIYVLIKNTESVEKYAI